MKEVVDVLNENGESVNRVVTRKESHELGLWHRVVVIAIIDNNGHVLMQQRSKFIESYPGKWDVSVAGHVSAGQSSKEAAIREVSEELGITIKENELNYIFTDKYIKKLKENYIINHIYDFYIVKRNNINVEDIKMRDSEVEQIKLCNSKDICNLLSEEKVIKLDKVYEDLMKYLK